MNKLIITEKADRLTAILFEDGTPIEIGASDAAHASLVGRIYVGRISHINKNIMAAFINIGTDKPCYCPLSDLERYCPPGTPLREGDFVPVQIKKDASGIKSAVATAKLSIAGDLVIVMNDPCVRGVSDKISDRKERSRLKNIIESPEYHYGIIIRTNAHNASDEAIKDQIKALCARLDNILAVWSMRPHGTLLYEPDPFYITDMLRKGMADAVLTDIPDVYDKLCGSYSEAWHGPSGDRTQVLLYSYDLPLCSLYGTDTILENALQRKVWLKSGGFLFIEPTQALVSIDVNTGKAIKGSTPEETFFKINLEAAHEAARQIRLRNLSGIIMVDFIDMNEEAHRKELLRTFTQALAADPVQTDVWGFTKLGLAEVSRRKIRRPLYEYFV